MSMAAGTGGSRSSTANSPPSPKTASPASLSYVLCLCGAPVGLEIPDLYIREGVYHDPDNCEAVTRELLTLPERPTCIIFPDDFSYIGGLKALTDAGLRVPEDISAVGYDGIHLARVLKLTTYYQDTKALGTTAAKKLIQLIEHPKTTLMDSAVIPGRLLQGDTVKAI